MSSLDDNPNGGDLLDAKRTTTEQVFDLHVLIDTYRNREEWGEDGATAEDVLHELEQAFGRALVKVEPITVFTDEIERLQRALDQVENICRGTEDALREGPSRGIHFSEGARLALETHIKNTRLVIAYELGAGRE